MFDLVVSFCQKIWPLILVGGVIFGMYKAAKTWVKGQVRKVMDTKVDAVEFKALKEQNASEHADINVCLGNIEGKIDTLLTLNGGGRDG